MSTTFTSYKLPRFGKEDEAQRIYLSKLFADIYTQVTTGVPPSGVAGGVLTGTYPNPGMAATGVATGTYGDGTNVPRIHIDPDGRIDSATTVPISGAVGPTGPAGPAGPTGPAGGGGAVTIGALASIGVFTEWR